MLDVAAPPPSTAPQPVAPPPAAEHHVSFHDILSALNPLQYLPGIGTIYRALTGDQIPEPIRRIGSLVVSFLVGGPIGAAINVAMVAAEKITGFDLDATGQALVKGDGVGSAVAAGSLAGSAPGAIPPGGLATLPAASPAASPASSAALALATPASTPAPALPSIDVAWSPVQLAAYGVSTALDGSLRLGALAGADVLNSLELSRLKMAQFAYGRAAGLAA
jgi:hypothetical protein